jgi:hypothetical protein
MQFVVGRWAFHPVVDSSAQVSGVFSYVLDDSAIDENVRAVWIERVHANGQSDWRRHAWYLGDRALALRSLVAYRGIAQDSIELISPQVLEELDLSTTVETPAPMIGGLFADDPFQSLLSEVPDRRAVVTELVRFGYAAAQLGDGGGETGNPPLDGCEDEMLSAMAIAIGVGGEVADPEAVLSAFAAETFANCGLCWPSTLYSTPSAWIPGPCSGWAFVMETGSPATVNCEYVQTCFEVRTRSCSRLHADCSITVSSQSQTRVIIQNDSCSQATAGTCPATPACPVTGFNSIGIPTPWLPLCW